MLQLTPRHVATPHRPKYLQLADAIRQAIADEYLLPADNLPSEADIATQVSVSKAVVRQCLDQLVGEGVIQRRNGVPARVTPAGQVRVISDDRYLVENHNILHGQRPKDSAFSIDHGIEWGQYRIDIDISREVATPKDRTMLALEPGAYVWRRSFVKYAGDDPVEIQRSAIPENIAELNPDMIDPARQPPFGGTQRELAEAGSRPTEVLTEVVSRMPTENEKRDLRIAQVPVLDIERVFWDGETPVEASRLVVPASRHRLFYRTMLPA